MRPRTLRRDEAADLGSGISRELVLLLAVACGAVVANVYYAQPLLHTLGHAFGVSNGTAGLLVTVTQIGYVLGLAFVVPLGDLRERRGLITGILLVTSLGLAVTALAPSFAVFAAAIAVVGLTSVVAQVIVPMASSLAADNERGRVVGTVMSGLLIGILLARTVSGLVSSALGWRAVFWLAAAGMVALSATLRRRLPRVLPTTDVAYRELLRSVLTLVAREPVLRQRMLIGALTFGGFSTLWTPLSFLLAGGPFHYGNAVIGLFGLAGVAGAGAATLAGRLADRGRGRETTMAALAIMLISWAILAAGATAVIPLIIGIAVFDLGAQALHISNQNAIYAVAPEARSRLTTAYMVSYFLGGAVFSAVASAVYSSGGWGATCILGSAIAGAAIVAWGLTEVTARRGRAVPGEA